MEEAQVPVNGSELYTETVGEEPALVLIHAGYDPGDILF